MVHIVESELYIACVYVYMYFEYMFITSTQRSTVLAQGYVNVAVVVNGLYSRGSNYANA